MGDQMKSVTKKPAAALIPVEAHLFQKGGNVTTHLKFAEDALFPQDQSVKTGNVKFFLGSNRLVTAEQLAEQLNRADSQARDRAKTEQPSGKLDGDLPTERLGS